MPLQLGDQNPTVRQWRHVMNARFGGLYTRLHGPLGDTDQFGPRAVSWQQEYQRRTQQVKVDGVVSDNDLRALGIAVPARHTIFTVNGFLGDMWSGYPAVCGQAMNPSSVYWQPIGWANSSIPMTGQINLGEQELINQINLRPGTFMFALYSEGEIVGARVLQELQTGSLQHRMQDFIGAVTFGAPMREEHSHPPECPDPGGHGIARDRTVGTPDFWWDYADPGDMYTCTPDGPEGADITSCYQMIAQSNIIGGQETIATQIFSLLTNPASNAIPMTEAIIKAISFFGSGVASHVHYHDREILPGITYLQHAINHLNERARAVEPRST